MHLDEERVQRLLHGELPPPAESSARAHLDGCSDCRRLLAEAEREENELHALLRELDHPAPSVDADAIAAAVATTMERPQITARLQNRPLLWQAASMLVALGLVGAAYAVPGSPLPGWVAAVAEWIGDRPETQPPAPAPVQGPGSHDAGIAVAPGRNLVILFTSPQTEGQARVSLTDAAEIVVRAPIGAATFTSDAEQLVIDNRGSATFEIGIPRAAPRVEIRVAGVRVFLKEGPRVTTEESANGPTPYIVPLTHSRS
jgi:hypothetical protein